MQHQLWTRGALVCAMLSFSTYAHADLLGYWTANAPNEDGIVANDFGNEEYVAEFGLDGDAGFTVDGGGVTGAAGDYGMEFFGIDEDYAEVMIPGIEYHEITIAGWVNGNQTGAWSGLFQTRDDPPIGIGYHNDTSRLSYTWNDNNGNSWDFPASSPDGDNLFIEEGEWTFVALSLDPNAASLFVGPKGGELLSATNDIPHLTQAPSGEGWRFGEDNCCGTERNFEGVMDDFAIWNHRLLPDEIAALHAMEKIPTDFTERTGGKRQVDIAGTDIGADAVDGVVSNLAMGSTPTEGPGLAQHWYEGNVRPGNDPGGVDFFLDPDDPIVEPFATSTTWWAGGQKQNIVSDLAFRGYPGEIAAQGGTAPIDNYGVKLEGEYFVKANGELLIRDGIDDFAMIAIDQDGNGELDSLNFDDISNEDAGLLGPDGAIGDVIVFDDSWSNIDGSNQMEETHGLATFENIPEGGEWRKIEIWMSEAGGGDAGIVYAGEPDDPDIFDQTSVDGISQQQIDAYVIRNDEFRSTALRLESGESAGALNPGVEYILQVGSDASDRFVIDDGNGVLTTTLDVAGAEITVQVDGTLSDGSEYQIFDADNVTGSDSLTLNFADASQWDLSRLGEGIIVFGVGDSSCNPNTMGDVDGSGDVAFADFLILSQNFGQTVGGAESVPEPSGLLLFGLAGLCCGILRRRRN